MPCKTLNPKPKKYTLYIYIYMFYACKDLFFHKVASTCTVNWHCKLKLKKLHRHQHSRQCG